LLIFPILLNVYFQIKGQTIDEVGKISGEVTIDLKEEKLLVNVKYDYIANEETESTVNFHLDKKFIVKMLECRPCISFTFDRPKIRFRPW